MTREWVVTLLEGCVAKLVAHMLTKADSLGSNPDIALKNHKNGLHSRPPKKYQKQY